MSSFLDNVVLHIQAGYQALWIPTLEEVRCEEELQAARLRPELAGERFELVIWDCVEGFHGREENPLFHPLEALQAIPSTTFEGNKLVVFRDLPEILRQDAAVRRALRNLCQTNALVNPQHRRPLLILSPTSEVPEEIAPHVSVVDFRLPGEEELGRVFEFLSQGLADNHSQGAAHCPDDLRPRVIQALKGLTATEAENALSMALYRHGGFAPEMLETLEQHKAAAIRKSEVLTYLPKERIATEEEIGGYEELLDFIRMRAVAYSPEARRAGLDLPKGIVLLGVPGTGKSMVGKAVARLLKLPLALFDVASVFASLVGESERRMRTALATVEALDGCVLLLDEADKAVGGAHEARGDAGVTRRVFGQLLTWLAEKQDRTFVVATLNRIEGMPPEFLRKGRFDEVFYADLPEPDERRQILAIHLHKRGIDPQRYGEEEWRQLVEATKDFVGSELEELVKAARFLAFEHRKDATPTVEELLESARATNPIAKLEAENVRAIRDFCRKRARPVSGRRDSGDRRRERHVATPRVAPAAVAENGDGFAVPAGAAGRRQR